MSTSPSWFDQDKFSRLVKKVGTTTRSVGVPNAPTLPASSPSAPTSTGPVQLPPTPPEAPEPAEPEASAPVPPADETPSRPGSSAIPKPKASVPLFTFKSPTSSGAVPRITPAPVAKAPEQAPEDKPEPPPTAPAPVARVFLAPVSAEVPAPEPTPPQDPEPAPEMAERAADFHVAEQSLPAKKPGLTTTSTLQRLPRIMPGGSKPPAAPTQSRSVSALSRRTTSLPGVKPLTAPLPQLERAEAPIRVADTPASPATPPPIEPPPLAKIVEFPKESNEVSSPPFFPAPKTGETIETWESSTVPPDEVASYKEQIAHLNQERDNLAAKVAELTLAAQEGDEARLEAVTLRSQLAAAEAGAAKQNAALLQNNEITLVTAERDSARRDYIELRQQYETLKREQGTLKNEHAAALAGLQKQLEASQEQAGAATGRDDAIETLKQELKSLHEQVAQAKDEASTAQRGLALSQKALQEMRDALREASDGKGALESLKKERSTLVQQNMVLQAQNDQVSRELSALKAKGSK